MPTPIPLRPFLLRRAHLRLLVAAVEQAQAAVGEAASLAAAERFFGQSFADQDALDEHLMERDGHSQFFPWLLWDAEFAAKRGKRQPSGPVGNRLLTECRDPSSREVLQALLAASADVYQVVGMNEESTVLECIADGRHVVVTEPVLRAVATAGELFLARVVDCGDCCLLDAVHACLPQGARRALLRAARKARSLPKPERLPLLLAAADRAMGRLADPGARDGQELLRVTAVHLLDDVEGLLATLASAVRDGALDQPSPWRFVIVDPDFGPAGAVLRVTRGRLYSATTSPQRARSLRSSVEKRLPVGRHACTLYRDLDGLLDPASRSSWGPVEMQTVAADWVGECLATFHDTPHAWLGGVTPREAVRTATGRTQLTAWLRTVEQVSEVAGPVYRNALQSLRRDLAEG